MDTRFRVGVFFDPTVVNELAFFDGVIRFARSHTWRIVVGEEILSLSRSELGRWEGDGVVGFLRDPAFIAALKRVRLPAVNTSLSGTGLGIPSVVPDTVAAGRMAAQYFIERGFRRFAYFAEGPPPDRDRRLRGFSARLSEIGLSCEVFFQSATPSEDRAWAQRRAALVAQLRRLPKPIAVWARADRVSARILGACEAGHIQVPHDVAAMGFGNERALCPYTRPQLSSIGVAFESIGFRAAELLQKLMEGKPDAPETVLMAPTGVVERGSTDAIAQLDPQLAKALSYIEQHACDPVWVEDVLAYMGMNRRGLERLFQEHLHRSPNSEIVRVRVRRARLLLAERDKPLAEVASSCGFAEYRGLSSAFKRTVGVTPRAYRKNLPKSSSR